MASCFVLVVLVVYWSEFLVTEPEGSIPGIIKFSEE
jgi:hypothetical protein